MEDVNINPTPIETEPSGAYDAFEVAQKINDAYLNQNAEAQNAQPEQTLDNPPTEGEPAPAPAPENQEGQSEEANPNPADVNEVAGQGQESQKGYTPEEMEQLQALARRGLEFENFIRSEEGREVLNAIKARRAELAKKAEAETQPQNTQADPNERWRKANAETFGIEGGDEYFDAFDEKVKNEVQRQLQPTLQELNAIKQSRDQNDLNFLADSFVDHLVNKKEMDLDLARSVTYNALSEIHKVYPKFDRNTYFKALRAYESTHLDEPFRQIKNSQIKKLQKEIEELKALQAQTPQPTPSPVRSTTAVAADRMNSAYKSQGAIPSGSASNGGQTTITDAEQVEAALRSLR